MAADMTFIQSKRGNKMLVLGGFMFTMDRKVNEKIFWKCSRYSKCKARVITKHDRLERSTCPHNHDPDERIIETKMIVHRMKERAKKEITVPVPKIYKEEMKAVIAASPEAASYFPPFKSVDTILHRARSSAMTSHFKNEVGQTSTRTRKRKKKGEKVVPSGDRKTNNHIEVIPVELHEAAKISNASSDESPDTASETSVPNDSALQNPSSTFNSLPATAGTESLQEFTPKIVTTSSLVNVETSSAGAQEGNVNSLNKGKDQKNASKMETPVNRSNDDQYEELDTFLRSISVQMRKLPEEYSLELMAEIQNIIIRKRLAYIRETKRSCQTSGLSQSISSSSCATLSLCSENVQTEHSPSENLRYQQSTPLPFSATRSLSSQSMSLELSSSENLALLQSNSSPTCARSLRSQASSAKQSSETPGLVQSVSSSSCAAPSSPAHSSSKTPQSISKTTCAAGSQVSSSEHSPEAPKLQQSSSSSSCTAVSQDESSNYVKMEEIDESDTLILPDV